MDISIVGNRYIETPMGSLPLDLLRPIVEHLAGDFRSLLAISLVSHELRMEGQRILFRKVVLSFCGDRHVKFLTAITSSSLLAPLVKEYHLFDLVYKVEPFWGLTRRGLQAMVNLKILRFCTLRGEKVSAEILHACTFQLEVFQWNNRDHDDTEQVSAFLQTQPHLRILSVFWHGPDLGISGICPRLQVLHGDQYTINAFLPGRRITSLKWTPNEEELLLNDPVDHLSEEFHYIRFFSFGGLRGRSRLDLVIPHLRAVEVLEIGLESLAGPVCLNHLHLRRMYTFLINHTGTSIILRNPQVTNPHPL